MIEFVMEQQGLTRQTLRALSRSTSTRSRDIMERRRPLSLAMIRRLAKGLRIPANLLIQEYELACVGDWQARNSPHDSPCD